MAPLSRILWDSNYTDCLELEKLWGFFDAIPNMQIDNSFLFFNQKSS